MNVDFKLWEIVVNPPLVAALVAMASAQVFKVVAPLGRGKPPELAKLTDYGGFPSGHTAFITARAAGIGLKAGFDSALFALAAVTASILIYDIVKLRKTVDLTRRETDRLLERAGMTPLEKAPQFGSHSVAEIVAGLVWGLVCAVATALLWP